MKAIEKFGAIFDKIVSILMYVASFLIVLDAVWVTIDVMIRYSFHINFAPLLEITEYTLIWMTFLGTTWIMRTNTHIRTDMIVNSLKPKPKVMVNIITSIICACLLAALTWYTAKLTLFDQQTNFKMSSILEPIKWPIEIVIPVGFFMLFTQLVRNISKYLAAWKLLPKEKQPAGASVFRGEV
jgi:C4-dicarboxylate transporter DctQ subunit